jgi:hypothetical protein
VATKQVGEVLGVQVTVRGKLEPLRSAAQCARLSASRVTRAAMRPVGMAVSGNFRSGSAA